MRLLAPPPCRLCSPLGDIANVYILLAGLAFGGLLRLSKEDRVTVGIGFAVRNVALASTVAITLLNRLEYARFTVVYFLAEVALLLGLVRWARVWRTPAGLYRDCLRKVPVMQCSHRTPTSERNSKIGCSSSNC